MKVESMKDATCLPSCSPSPSILDAGMQLACRCDYAALTVPPLTATFFATRTASSQKHCVYSSIWKLSEIPVLHLSTSHLLTIPWIFCKYFADDSCGLQSSQLCCYSAPTHGSDVIAAVEQSGERMAVLTTLVGLLELKHLHMEGEDGTGSLESDIQLMEVTCLRCCCCATSLLPAWLHDRCCLCV